MQRQLVASTLYRAQAGYKCCCTFQRLIYIVLNLPRCRLASWFGLASLLSPVDCVSRYSLHTNEALKQTEAFKFEVRVPLIDGQALRACPAAQY